MSLTLHTNEIAVQEPRLYLHGHLAGLGDVSVRSGEWLGGPHGPARIEGLALELQPTSPDWEIRYAVQIAGPNGPRAGSERPGQFAGTRGRLLPITMVAFQIVTPASSDAEITVEGLFLGSPIRRVRGRHVVLTGPSKSEPLVGLRINLAAQLASAGSAPVAGLIRLRSARRR